MWMNIFVWVTRIYCVAFPTWNLSHHKPTFLCEGLLYCSVIITFIHLQHKKSGGNLPAAAITVRGQSLQWCVDQSWCELCVRVRPRMKIAVLGATGQTGLYLVHQALQQGHTVTAVIRNPRKLTVHHDNLKVTEQWVICSVLLVSALMQFRQCGVVWWKIYCVQWGLYVMKLWVWRQQCRPDNNDTEKSGVNVHLYFKLTHMQTLISPPKF